MSGHQQQRRALGILVTAIVPLSLTSPSAQGPTALPLASVTYFGGIGDQRAHAVSIHGGAVYIAGSGDPFHPYGLLLRYDLPPGDPPAWSRTFEFESPLLGISARSEGLYTAGHSLQLTQDFVGARETKGIVAQFALDGSTGGAPGGANWVTGGPGNLGAFFAADRHEQFQAIVTATEGGAPVVYAAGRGDAGGCPSIYTVGKYDAAGAFLAAATDSSTGVTFAGCDSMSSPRPRSDATAIAMLNSNIYLAGVADWPGNSNTPTVWKYDPHMNLQWRSGFPTEFGPFTSLAAIGGALYAVGSNFNSALIAKFHENGTVLRSSHFGLGPDGALTGVVGVGNRVFAVGYRTQFQGTSHDGVVFEFDPESLQIISTTPFGSANDDDKLTALATDGIDLYAVGESRRAALGSPGDYDIVLVKYALGTPHDTTPPSTAARTNPLPNGAGWNNTPVDVTLIGDDGDGFGVSSINYLFFGEPSIVAEGSSTTFEMSEDAVKTVNYWATDLAGNIQPLINLLTVRIDKIVPATAVDISSFLPPSGWYREFPSVHLTASDTGGSGLASLSYRIGTGSPVPLPGLFRAPLPGFPEGTTTAFFAAVDVAGNVEPEQALTIKVDRTPPVTTASAYPAPNFTGWNNTDVDVTLEGTDGVVGSGVASITYQISRVALGPFVTGPRVTVPGGTAAFALSLEGQVNVQYWATDVAEWFENQHELTFLIDKTPPSFPSPPDVVPWEATGPDGDIVNFTVFTEDAVSGVDRGTLQVSHPSGSLFPYGATTVTVQARDRAGNLGTRQFTVLVQDTKPPDFSAPAQPPREATGPDGAAVSFSFSATDVVDGPVPVICDRTSGSMFPIGRTTMHCSATDSHGNTIRREIPIDVRDTTPPTLVFRAPSPAANGAGWTNSDVTIGFTVADNGPGPLLTSLPSPLVFSTDGAGLRQVVVVTDQAGNSATFTSPAVSVDKTPPVVGYLGNAGTYTVDQQVEIRCVPSDGLSGVASTNCADISGPALSFALGVNAYVADAVDRAGNVGHGATSFAVTVTSASLGALVTRFSPSGGVANGLLAKLNAAAGASTVTARNGQLSAFINEVNAQIGNAFTAKEAQILTQFATVLMQ